MLDPAAIDVAETDLDEAPRAGCCGIFAGREVQLARLRFSSTLPPPRELGVLPSAVVDSDSGVVDLDEACRLPSRGGVRPGRRWGRR